MYPRIPWEPVAVSLGPSEHTLEPWVKVD